MTVDEALREFQLIFGPLLSYQRNSLRRVLEDLRTSGYEDGHADASEYVEDNYGISDSGPVCP
jgi:hypothetical protein